ncbi:hypothetical protein QQ045_015767 [Rhodiola kirilowii]
MAAQSSISLLANSLFSSSSSTNFRFRVFPVRKAMEKRLAVVPTVLAMDRGGEGDAKMNSAVNTNYVVPFDKYNSSATITRPLAEILRDLNKRIPDTNIASDDSTRIPWYHANRMLSFYAPGWCGEIRDVIFSDNGSVTVVFRVTIRGSDGEAHRESTGTVSPSDANIEDPVAAAEEIAFCRACARFGLGLYLYQK